VSKIQREYDLLDFFIQEVHGVILKRERKKIINRWERLTYGNHRTKRPLSLRQREKVQEMLSK